MVYICFHCQKQVDNNKDHRAMTAEPSNTIEEMKSHWESNHALKPFLYYAVGVGACFYCDYIDTFSQLQAHYQQKHAEHTFIVVDQRNRSKCGLCHKIFSNTDMHTHFKSEHHSFYLYGTFSPICFTQKEIDWLIRWNLSGIVENPSKVQYFICGHCSLQYNADTMSLKQHYEQDKFLFQCSNCVYTTKRKHELFAHEKQTHNLSNVRTKHFEILKNRSHKYYLRTKLIFSNGLVLFNHNLLNTKFDDRNDFWPFVEHFVAKIFPTRAATTSHNTQHDVPPKIAILRTKELARQRQFRNNLCILGIEHVQKERLLPHFLQICDAIGAPIQPENFTIFKRKHNDVIVKLTELEIKKRILKAWNDCENANRIGILKSINIQNDLTRFFQLLWESVEIAKEKKHIHSFWISERGLNVKRTQTSKSIVIWSKKSLMKLCGQ